MNIVPRLSLKHYTDEWHEDFFEVFMTPGANDAAILGAEIIPQCEFIDMVQLVLFLFTIAIGNLSEK